MKYIDSLLNRVTMYRLLLYSLAAYTVAALAWSFAGKLHFTPTELIASLGSIVAAAYVTDRALSRYFKVPTNMETALLTSLILFLILRPADSVSAALFLAVAGVISSASKFLINWQGKHIFNPAAFAAGTLSLTGWHSTIWWVGSSLLWPLTLILGLAVARKIRRLPLVLVFAVVALLVQAGLLLHAGRPLIDGLQADIISSPFIFLGTIMLTEPATMPPRRQQQLIFGALVAVLYATSWRLGRFVIYPEVALLIGNLYAFAVAPKFRTRLQLASIETTSDSVASYLFKPDRPFSFRAGQYLEWTLPGVPFDSRGNRRSFTIASSPTEAEVMLGVRFYKPPSAYKSALQQLKPGDSIFVGMLAGDFTLPATKQKLLFIAGGIGITPFRSMIKYLTDKGTQCDITLLYVVNDAKDLAYTTEFNAAAQVGIKFVPITTRLTTDSIKQLVPDASSRLCYISGPPLMVDGTKGNLRQLGVPRTRIKTDHFSGY